MNKTDRPVVIIVPPFASITRPSLAAGLLKARLKANGLRCIVSYSNLRFAQFVGLQEYVKVSENLSPRFLLGEWVFATAAFGKGQDERSGAERYFRRIASAMREDGDAVPSWLFDWLSSARKHAGPFVEEEARRTHNLTPSIVGFTSTFQQTVASIALARTMRKVWSVATVIGGANCEGEMGQALFEAEDAFDYVCLGEGEEAIVELARSAADGTYGPVANCLGPRQTHRSVPPVENRPVAIEYAPAPDYDEYFNDLRVTQAPLQPVLVYEASRGCWWGQKHHCTFCGLSEQALAWRQKSSSLAVRDMIELRKKYGNHPILMADLIFPQKFFNDGFLDELERNHFEAIFFEIKANISKNNLFRLRDAGVSWVQPGVESFSTPTLKLMRKGVTGAQNVAMLKWAAACGMTVIWNFLFGFPGERDDWYEGVNDQLSLLWHLQPPVSVGRVRLDRFSPLREDRSFGASSRGAESFYAQVYPWDDAILNRLAYYFEMDVREAGCSAHTYDRLQSETSRWRRRWTDAVKPTLFGVRVEDATWIKDARKAEICKTYPLSSEASLVLNALDTPRSRSQLDAALRDVLPTTLIEQALQELVRRDLLFQDGELTVGLAVFPRDEATPRFQTAFPGGGVVVPPSMSRAAVPSRSGKPCIL